MYGQCDNTFSHLCNKNVHKIILKMLSYIPQYNIANSRFNDPVYHVYEGDECSQYLQKCVPFHLPQIESVLRVVIREFMDLEKKAINIIDIGSGPATVPIAFCRLFHENEHKYGFNITTIEPSKGFNDIIKIFIDTNRNKSVVVNNKKYDIFDDNLMYDESIFEIGYNWIIIANFVSAIGSYYFFSWEDLPGCDEKKLIHFLGCVLGIDTPKTTKINKTNDGNTINVTIENITATFTLNDHKTKAILTINDDKTYEFIADMEDGKLNIYPNKDTQNQCVNKILNKLISKVLYYNNKVLLTIIESGSKKYMHIPYYISKIKEIGFDNLKILDKEIYTRINEQKPSPQMMNCHFYRTNIHHPRYSPIINTISLWVENKNE